MPSKESTSASARSWTSSPHVKMTTMTTSRPNCENWPNSTELYVTRTAIFATRVAGVCTAIEVGSVLYVRGAEVLPTLRTTVLESLTRAIRVMQLPWMQSTNPSWMNSTGETLAQAEKVFVLEHPHSTLKKMVMAGRGVVHRAVLHLHGFSQGHLPRSLPHLPRLEKPGRVPCKAPHLAWRRVCTRECISIQANMVYILVTESTEAELTPTRIM